MERAIRLVGHQINHGEADRDLGTRRALEAMIDLVLPQLRGLIEQVHRGQSLRLSAHDFIAAPAHGGELAKIIEQA